MQKTYEEMSIKELRGAIKQRESQIKSQYRVWDFLSAKQKLPFEKMADEIDQMKTEIEKRKE